MLRDAQVAMQKLKEYGGLAIFAVVVVLLVCLMSGVKPTPEVFIMLIGGTLAAAGCIVVFALVSAWAEKTKSDHERKKNDGSLDYRFSQIRYVIALLILDIVGLLLILAILQHKGRGN